MSNDKFNKLGNSYDYPVLLISARGIDHKQFATSLKLAFVATTQNLVTIA